VGFADCCEMFSLPQLNHSRVVEKNVPILAASRVFDDNSSSNETSAFRPVLRYAFPRTRSRFDSTLFEVLFQKNKVLFQKQDFDEGPVFGNEP
jgi:hypothetical protein